VLVRSLSNAIGRDCGDGRADLALADERGADEYEEQACCPSEVHRMASKTEKAEMIEDKGGRELAGDSRRKENADAHPRRSECGDRNEKGTVESADPRIPWHLLQ
jgi:hypothetical protein